MTMPRSRSTVLTRRFKADNGCFVTGVAVVRLFEEIACNSASTFMLVRLPLILRHSVLPRLALITDLRQQPPSCIAFCDECAVIGDERERIIYEYRSREISELQCAGG